MKNFIISCHVEPIRKTGDISYLRNFFREIGKSNLPIILFLMFGEEAQDKIFRLCAAEPLSLPNGVPIGLHVHGGETEKAIKAYKKYFGVFPKLISFGHWNYRHEDLPTVKRFGVEKDFSYAAYRQNERYFLKKPFKNAKIWQYPVSCDPKFPLYPFSCWYHLFLTALLLVFHKFFSKSFVHVSFHSYDWQENDMASQVRRFLTIKLFHFLA